MGKIIVFTNISLDGYFEGPGHDLSGFKNDFEAFPAEPGQETGAFLFGHRTYEGMKFWATPQAAEMMPEDRPLHECDPQVCRQPPAL